MNTDLKKEKVIKNKYAKKYMERHKTLCVTLDNETDKDIIKWLAKQKNRSVTVRQILRTAARLEEGYNREEL